MGLLIFVLAFLGSWFGPGISIALRLWGRRVQAVSALVIMVIGGALVYAGVNPGIFGRLVLPR